MAPTYSGVLPTRAAVQCRRSSSAPPPAPPAPSGPSPLPLPPLLPPAPSSPQGFPRHRVCGGEGGALTGGALWVPCSWAGGGGASVACVMGPPTCAILGRVSRLELARPCAPLARRSWHRAGKTRPARTSGTECHPALCAPNCLSGRSPRTANNTAGRPATASRLVRPPRAAGRVRRGRLTRSPLFPVCFPSPLARHKPSCRSSASPRCGFVRWGRGASAAVGQARKNPRLPKRLPRK